jgi:BTB/POZ domain
METVILNVGGTKYETYKETLIKFPKTFLGTMFQERNNLMLKPRNGNEYFFDRNGKAFHCIMEFYRTGEVNWELGCGVTKRELEMELDYFMISEELKEEKKFLVEMEENIYGNEYCMKIEEKGKRKLRKCIVDRDLYNHTRKKYKKNIIKESGCPRSNGDSRKYCFEISAEDFDSVYYEIYEK